MTFGDGSVAEPDAYPAGEATGRGGMADLSPAAAERIRRFMADSTVRGGASPADVADLYLAPEILDDANATPYLDRRYVHGEMPADWRELQDRLSAAYLEGRPTDTADTVLTRALAMDDAIRAPRSIFDDPDEDELLEADRTERMEDRDPMLGDLSETSRRAIEWHIVSEVLSYGIAPYRVMQLREGLRSDGDERALQYLDLPFELGDRPVDWDALRDRALMARARLELFGADPTAAFVNADTAHPGMEISELLTILEDRDLR